MEQLIREMNEAIEKFGIGSKEALEASQRLDVEVAKQQQAIYSQYKRNNIAS